MKFVGRNEELIRLKQVLRGRRSTFTVLYGRRYIGKSTLLTKVLKSSDLYFLADQTESTLQRENLAKMVSMVIPNFDNMIYPNWGSLFDAINDRTTKRFTLCIDEFHYLENSSSDILSVIQNRVDAKQLKYNLVICSSSQHYVTTLIRDTSSPLYGRADAIIRVDPIELPFIAEALSLNAVESVEEYAVWGGVPRYWKLRRDASSLRKAITNNLLSIDGTLYDEPIKLLKEDVRGIAKATTIISYIGSGANRLSEIAARCGEPATNLSRPIARLLEQGHITKESVFNESDRNSKKSLYKISDQFISFYYHFVAPHLSLIKIGRIKPINAIIDKELDSFVGEYWAKLCRDTISGSEVNGITYGIARQWWGFVSRVESFEIDVVAESLDRRHLLVGRCRWSDSEDTAQLIANLRSKAEKLPFAKEHIIVPVLFLKSNSQVSSEQVLLPQDIIDIILSSYQTI